MISQPGWRSMANRRSNTRLTVFYKLLHGLIAISPLQYMQPAKRGDQAYSFSGLYSATSLLCLLCADIFSQKPSYTGMLSQVTWL